MKTDVLAAQVPTPTTTCGNAAEALGAKLGADFGPASERHDPDEPPAPGGHRAPDAADLAALLSAWATLPEPVKAGIAAMVKAADAAERSTR